MKVKIGDEVYLRVTVVDCNPGIVVAELPAGGHVFALPKEIVLPSEMDAEFRVGTNHPATSQAIEPKMRTGSFQSEILEFFDTDHHGPFPIGYTDDELEVLTGRTHQSISATRNTLMRKGLIVASAGTRMTRSGNEAIVWHRSPVEVKK